MEIADDNGACHICCRPDHPGMSPGSLRDADPQREGVCHRHGGPRGFFLVQRLADSESGTLADVLRRGPSRGIG